MSKHYSRILLKISGEALKGDNDIYNVEYLESIYKMVKNISDMKTQVAIVVGGGNIYRGALASSLQIERTTGDYMGMLATLINAMCLQSYFENKGLDTRVMSAIPVNEVCEPYIRRRAIRHLEKGRVVIFACGVGSPFFTTDTCVALRAKEINADGIFVGKNGVDGIYDSDPKKVKDAKLLKHVSYTDIIKMQLKIIDSSAASLLEDSNIETRIFNMNDPSNVIKVIKGEDIGTIVSSKK